MEKADPDVMDRPPRPTSEPIIHGPMRQGILIQSITQTAAVLTAFGVGLLWHLENALPAGVNPLLGLLQHDWRADGVDVQIAETMAFVTLSLCELMRAFTVRSERLSIFQIGPFSNRYMVGAVLLSVVLLLLVVFVPILQPIFNTHASKFKGVAGRDRDGADPGGERRDHQVDHAAARLSRVRSDRRGAGVPGRA